VGTPGQVVLRAGRRQVEAHGEGPPGRLAVYYPMPGDSTLLMSQIESGRRPRLADGEVKHRGGNGGEEIQVTRTSSTPVSVYPERPLQRSPPDGGLNVLPGSASHHVADGVAGHREFLAQPHIVPPLVVQHSDLANSVFSKF
jgi:hypothetical protein